MSLLAELKRRNVIRVGIAYAAGAWVLAQAADLVLDVMGAPDVILRSLVAILALGFVPALIFAWAFEITPEGIKKEKDVDRAQSVTGQTARKLSIATMALVIGAVLLLALDRLLPEQGPGREQSSLPPVGGSLAADGASREQSSLPQVGGSLAADGASREQSSLPQVGGSLAADGASREQGSLLQQSSLPQAIPAKSIAVLPFRDLSPAGDQGWLADGISAEISTLLTRVGVNELLVIDTNSAFQMRDQGQNFKSIREALRVNYLLTGGLRRNADELLLTVQLISTLDGSQQWSQKYARTMTDIFAVQEEIAEAVSTALQITLATGAFGKLPGMTRNAEAFEEYLKAFRDVEGEAVLEQVRNSIAHLEQALAIDPGFSHASEQIYAFYRYTVPYIATYADFPEQEQRAAEALAHIRAVDPANPQLLYFEGRNHAENGEWVEADRKISASVEQANLLLGTTGAYAGRLAQLRQDTGRIRDAAAYWERARLIDPLNYNVLFMLAEAAASTGNSELALELNASILALPGMGEYPRALGQRLHLMLGLHEPARLDTYDHAMPAGPTYTLNAEMMALRNDPQQAMVALRTYAAKPDISPLVLGFMSSWAAYFGDPQFALDLTRRSLRLSSNSAGMFIARPVYAGMRKLPDFKQLVAEIGLLEYWQTTGNWGDYCRPLPATENDFECF